METLVVMGVEGLQSLREMWEVLHGTVGVYGRYEWHLACAMFLLVDRPSLSYVLVTENSRPVAIVPVVEGCVSVPPFGRLRTLSLGIHRHLSLMDFPLAQDVDHSRVAHALRELLWTWPRTWDVLWWPRCLATSNASRLGRLLGGANALFPPTSPCNVVDLDRDFAQFLAQRSKNLQANLKKAGRKLADCAGVHVSRNAVPVGPSGAPSAANGVCTTADEAYDRFLGLETSGWKGAAGTGSAISLDPATRGFYAWLLNARHAGFATEVTLLHRESRPIAGHFSITVGSRRELLKIAYDESEAKFSPGQILLCEVLQSLSTTDCDTVSLVTNMPWHQPWRPRPESTHGVLIYRKRWRHLAHALRQSIIRRLRATGQRFGESTAPSLHAKPVRHLIGSSVRRVKRLVRWFNRTRSRRGSGT